MSLWMKVFSILFIFQFTLINPIKAQVVLETDSIKSDYYDIEEEEEDEEGDDVKIPLGEDELAVKDKEGNEELIEFPEAMTYDLDSLLNLYMSKTYLSGINDCNMKDENPVFTKEEYIERLSRIPSVMTSPYPHMWAQHCCRLQS